MNAGHNDNLRRESVERQLEEDGRQERRRFAEPMTTPTLTPTPEWAVDAAIEITNTQLPVMSHFVSSTGCAVARVNILAAIITRHCAPLERELAEAQADAERLAVAVSHYRSVFSPHGGGLVAEDALSAYRLKEESK